MSFPKKKSRYLLILQAGTIVRLAIDGYIMSNSGYWNSGPILDGIPRLSLHGSSFQLGQCFFPSETQNEMTILPVQIFSCISTKYLRMCVYMQDMRNKKTTRVYKEFVSVTPSLDGPGIEWDSNLSLSYSVLTLILNLKLRQVYARLAGCRVTLVPTSQPNLN